MRRSTQPLSALRDGGFYLTVLVAILLGLVGGLITVTFVKVLLWLEHLIWTSLPNGLQIAHYNIYTLVMCVVGGVLVGLCGKYFGDRPPDLETSMAEFKQTKQFDYQHLPQAMIASLASLGFGAALGPEAALVTLVGGLSTWIGQRLKLSRNRAELATYIGISGTLGALFHTPLGSAAIGVEDERRLSSRLWRYVPGVAAAAAGWWIYKQVSSGSYFDFTYPSYQFAAIDLVKALVPTLVAALVGLVMLVVLAAGRRAFRGLGKRVILRAVLGGVGLAILAMGSGLILFSGHEGVQTIINANGHESAAFLIMVAIGKMVAAGLLLAAGWKGGKFFPSMFAGAAAGLAVTHLALGIPAMAGLAPGLAAGMGAVLRRPLLVLVFAILFFPVVVWPMVAIGALGGSAIGKQVTRRLPVLAL